MNHTYFDEEEFGRHLSEEELLALIEEESANQLPALKELFRRNTPKSLEIAERILKNDTSHRRLKMTTISYLASKGGTAQARWLLDVLKEGQNQAALERKMVRALGRIGDESMLSELEGLESQAETLPFACTLISYRKGLNKFTLATEQLKPLPNTSAQGEVKLQPISKKRSEELNRMLAVRHKLPTTSEEALAELDCNGNTYLLKANEPFQDAANFSLLNQQNAIPFHIFRLEGCPHSLTLKYYVMTHPGKSANQLQVNVTDTSGRICYSGEMEWKEEALAFQLQSVENAFVTPAIFRGKYHPSNQQLELDEARVSARGISGTRKIPMKAS